jgi:hypothetical protein
MRSIELAPGADLVLARRDPAAPFCGEFTETSLDRDVRPGDFVTVVCRHEGRRLVGLHVTVTEVTPLDAR